MNRYSDYARNLRKIPNVKSYSSRATILPLREFPQKCDPRRLCSYQKNQDIERSREDQPLVTISVESYKLRRIVVPPIRSQYIEPSRIPNARDPRGLRACQKFNSRSKNWKYVPNWVPTLVENDEVLQEEETCAVFVIDVSEWESKGIKRSYIEIIPHECNVQRSLVEVERQLTELVGVREDELLMTPDEAREAEKNMQASTSNDRTNDYSDIEECDSDGEVLPKETSAVFDTIDDRPMLEINEEQAAGSANQRVPTPHRTDEDEDEDRVIYEMDKEPEELPVLRFDDADVDCFDIDTEKLVKKEPQELPAPKLDDVAVEYIDLDSSEEDSVVLKKEPQNPPPSPMPRSDDADIEIECINLDSDEEDPIVPKKESLQEAYGPFNKNLPREVLDEVTIIDDDSDDEEQALILVAMQLSKEENEANTSKSDNSPPTCCDTATSLSLIDSGEDLLRQSTGLRKGVTCKDYGVQVTEADHNKPDDHCVQRSEVTLTEIGWCIQSRDCDSDFTIESDLSDIVISESRPVKNYGHGKFLKQTEDNVALGAKVPETSDIADKAERSSDNDSDTSTVMQFETLADVHEVSIRDKANDVIAHSEISQMQQENEEAAYRVNIPVMANIMQKRKRIDRGRLDTNTSELCAREVIAVDKRRKENDDDAANDENQSDNCKALIKQASSPVFKALHRKRNKRAKKKLSKNVLQLSSTSTCVISKSNAKNHHRSIVLSNFSALGILNNYLKNNTATYKYLNFFSKNVEELSVFEFDLEQYIKRNYNFMQNRNNNWHHEENNVHIEDVTKENTFNQLAIGPVHACVNNEAASIYEVQPRKHKTVIEESAITLQNEQSSNTREDIINVTENSWLMRGNNKDDNGNIQSQRRHSLPMVTIPQQSFGVKRPRSGSNDNPIKLTLRRSQANDKWVATASTMPKTSVQCTLFNLNNSTQNDLEQIIPNKHIKSITKKACNSVNNVLSKWSYIEKEVPELDLDDFANRPLPQKIQFDKNKLSLSLQSRVKKRTTSVDSAIVSDIDDNGNNLNKRRKLTDFTKEGELTMNDIYNYDDDRLSFNDYIGESLEITELPSDSCTELSRPQSENICILNNNNSEDTFKYSERQKSSNLEIWPKNCLSNTNTSDQKCLNLNEKNASSLKNINQDFQDDSSSSDSSFHLYIEDELDDPSDTAQSQNSNIQIDHNCNLRKNSNSFDESCIETLNTQQNEVNLNQDSERQENSVDRLNKKMETLFRESNNNDEEKMIAITDNSVKTRLQSTEEKRSTANAVEQTCIKDSKLSAPNLTELGLMTTIVNNEEQLQHIFSEKDADTDATHENDNHVEISLSNNTESALKITSSANQDKKITSEFSTPSDHRINSPKNVDQHRDCLDVQNNQTLINNEKHVESNNALEFESNLSKDKQTSVIFHKEVDSHVSRCNINDDVTSKQVFHNERDEHFLDDALNVTNSENLSSKEGLMEEYEKHKENGKDSFENQETSDINTSSLSSNQDQGNLEIISLEDGLEEGDLDFHTSIHGRNTHSKYKDDDYDVNSDNEEYENQGIVEYSKDVGVQKSNESFVSNKNNDASNCVSNILETNNQSSTIETERVSTISENEHLHNSQELPLKIANDDATKSNLNNIIDVDEEDDDIIVEYENINNYSNHSKDVKLDISNVNNHLNVQVREISNIHVPNVDITLENESTVPKVGLPALLSQSSLRDKGSNVELVHLQTETSTKTMNFLDKSGVRIPVPNTRFLLSSTLNNSTTPPTTEVSVSNECNDQVSNASILKKSTLAVKPTIQSNKNINIDFNNPKILEKFNLTKEVIAPEDIKAENSVAFESNEEKILCNTLESMLKDGSVKECDIPKVINKQNHSSVEAPPTSSLVIEVSLPTGPHSENNYDLLKALNVNLDNEVDVITDKTVDRNPAKHGSPGVIKVKNLNDMLKKIPNPSSKNVTFNSNILPTNSIPNVPENIQQDENYGVDVFQRQLSLPVNIFSSNNPIPNPYLIQPPPPPPSYAYIVSQPISAGPIQPLVNMCNLLPVPMPIMNNVGQQVHFPNTGLINHVPIQNNVQIPAPAPAAADSSDKQIVLASSMFPGMFDSQATSSFCSKTVFNLQLPPLPNIILPPPCTILPSDDHATISNKIQTYKSKLLDKIIETLTVLENININVIRRQIEVLNCRQTLTEETWNIQEKMLIIAQCVGSFKKLTIDKNYSNIIEAIMGSIYARVRDRNLLKKVFGLFQQFKERGIFKSFSDEQQPLTLELGTQLEQTPIGMSGSQKEVLKYQMEIYLEMLKINRNQIQSIRVTQPNIQTKNQNPVQRNSPTALQQNTVTTTVSSSVSDIANNRYEKKKK